MDGDNHSSWIAVIETERDKLIKTYNVLYGTLRDDMECEIGADEIVEKAVELRTIEVRIHLLEGLL